MISNGVFRGSPYQQGYGLGGTFRKFFRWIVPLFQKHALPHIESGIKEFGKTALSAAADLAKDVVSGRNVREAATDRINTAVNSLKERAENSLEGKANSLEGKGIKRKRKKFKKFVVLKKKKNFKDIFD